MSCCGRLEARPSGTPPGLGRVPQREILCVGHAAANLPHGQAIKQCAGARCCFRSQCSRIPRQLPRTARALSPVSQPLPCILGAHALAPPCLSRGCQPPTCIFAGPVCVPVLAPASCLGAPFGPPPCLIPPAYHPCMNSHARQGPSHVFGACAMSTQNQSACPLCPVPVEPNPCAGTRPSSAAVQRAVQLSVDPCACNCVLTGHTCCYWRSHIAQVIGTKQGWWSGPRLTG